MQNKNLFARIQLISIQSNLHTRHRLKIYYFDSYNDSHALRKQSIHKKKNWFFGLKNEYFIYKNILAVVCCDGLNIDLNMRN